ncbi:hypothetical protein [Bacteroides sp.]|uniref:hypothetical protein n=1 Tax=Bacteroides sp. TaxID=29523 RepID=UPI003995C0B2
MIRKRMNRFLPVPGSSGVMMSLYEQNMGLPPLLISVLARMERSSTWAVFNGSTYSGGWSFLSG